MDDSQDYYIHNKVKLVKEFEEILSVAEKIAQTRFDKEELHTLRERSLNEFEDLLPQIPYLGGEKSPATALIMHSAQTIAFYKTCRNLGMEAREFAQLMYEVVEAYLESVSWIKKKLARWLAFSGRTKLRWKSWANKSQKREYPQNWVGEFIEGDGIAFDWGLNFEECGWLKMAREHGVEEIAPYACLADFARMGAFGVGYRRTETLAMGYPRCDFRFGKNLETPRGWPPENLDEFRNSPGVDKGL